MYRFLPNTWQLQCRFAQDYNWIGSSINFNPLTSLPVCQLLPLHGHTGLSPHSVLMTLPGLITDLNHTRNSDPLLAPALEMVLLAVAAAS